MADPAVCSQCGARNPAEAGWCGQCFASLSTDPVVGPDAAAPGGAGEAPADSRFDSGSTDSTTPEDQQAERDRPDDDKAGLWVCSVCETENPLDEQQCSACGTSIFTSFGATDEDLIEIDPQRALIRSVVFPGLGHAHAGQGLLGSAIGGLTVMALGFGIALVATGVGRFGWPLVLLAIGVWVAAALDASRIAAGQTTNALLLRPRVVTALVGLVVVVLILAALTAQSRT